MGYVSGPAQRANARTGPNPQALERSVRAVSQPTHEQWRPVVDYEGLYEVSDLGRVRSLDRITLDRLGKRYARKGRLLKPVKNTNGRLQVYLYRDGDQRPQQVHRLVLSAFVGPCPEGAEACHWDDDPTNNRLDNLRWASRSDNLYDRVRNGRDHNARKTHCANGHPYSPENTYVLPDGSRSCRICAMAKERRYQDANRERINARMRERRRREREAG